MTIRDYYSEEEAKDITIEHYGIEYKCFYVSHLGTLFELDPQYYTKFNMTGGKVMLMGFIDGEKAFSVSDRVVLNIEEEELNLIVRHTYWLWYQGLKVYYYMLQVA